MIPAGAERDRPVVWVFHRGALGDSVLLWPRLRAWVRAGSRVVLVTDKAKARLAEREIGVRGVDAEQPRFNRLWNEGGPVEPEAGVGLVLDCLGGGNAAFGLNLVRMFPGARIERGLPPRGGEEAAAWAAEHPLAQVAARTNEAGAIVLHVGTGSEAKRWPLDRWRDLGARLHARSGRGIVPIAGEVEAERFTPRDRALFSAMRGRFLHDLTQLADQLGSARLCIGCDSGPAHLAAQLGVPTLVLFGPTDPSIWAPVGPVVRVACPAEARPMDWLDVGTVLSGAEALLNVGCGGRAAPPQEEPRG